MITLSSMLSFLAFGLIVGGVGWLLEPKNERGPWVFYLLVGLLGAFVFGFAAHGLGVSAPGDRAGLSMSLVGAMLFVFAYHGLHHRFFAR